MMTNLESQRRANADAAWVAHVFAEGSEPESADGWEWSVPGNEWARVIYFDNAEDPDGPTIAGRYTVVFEGGSSAILSSHASIAGNDIGTAVAVRVFLTDETAPTLREDYALSSFQDLEGILDGHQEIMYHAEDSDKERWSLTVGGQFVRQTGYGLDRYYVVPAGEAFDQIGTWASPEVVEGLRLAGVFDLESPAPTVAV